MSDLFDVQIDSDLKGLETGRQMAIIAAFISGTSEEKASAALEVVRKCGTIAGQPVEPGHLEGAGPAGCLHLVKLVSEVMESAAKQVNDVEARAKN